MVRSHTDADEVREDNKAARAELDDVISAGHPPDTYTNDHDRCSCKQTDWQHAQVELPINDLRSNGVVDRGHIITPAKQQRSAGSPRSKCSTFLSFQTAGSRQMDAPISVGRKLTNVVAFPPLD